MLQSFDESSEPERGPERLAALRKEMAGAGLDGFVVPRADAWQGEYVAPCDARLAWLTGFTGSAGFCAALADKAAVFADGRYKVQLREQIDGSAFQPVDWPETKLGTWLADNLPDGGKVGFDPWLHTVREVEEWVKALDGTGIAVVPAANLVDAIWTDRPDPPSGKAFEQPVEFAGESAAEKCQRLGQELAKSGHCAAVLTQPDSICWLLNIRGNDIPYVPIVQAYAILTDAGRVDLYADPAKLTDITLPAPATARGPADFEAALSALDGPVRLDRASCPEAVRLVLVEAGTGIAWGDDPCQLPKACKNDTELAGMRAAHQRDAVAMVNFLAWLDQAAPKGRLTEIDAALKLEECRRLTNALQDLSFDTISATGPNAALPHYRVTSASNRTIRPGDLYLVDSGGQYRDGTTDITRTVATGPAGADEKAAFTRVLKGMIAISRLRFPRGLAGRNLDALARYPLWLAGQDYDHGTGHGVGSYLSVHEGPQRLSRLGAEPLREGMILSNEPGYYREGAFGIRIENLIAVEKAPETGDGRDQLSFETLTYVPIDRHLIETALLDAGERDWLNAYHAEVLDRIAPAVGPDVRDWLEQATAPL